MEMERKFKIVTNETDLRLKAEVEVQKLKNERETLKESITNLEIKKNKELEDQSEYFESTTKFMKEQYETLVAEVKEITDEKQRLEQLSKKL